MDEVGVRIVAHAAALQGQRGAAELEGVDAGHAQVDGFRLDVQTVFGDAVGVRAQRFVGAGRAIAADDVELAAGMADGGGEGRENVVEARIEVAHFVGVVVAQKIVQLGQRAGNELFAAAVNNVNALSGVRVVEHQAMLLGGRSRSLRRGRGVRVCARSGARGAAAGQQNGYGGDYGKEQRILSISGHNALTSLPKWAYKFTWRPSRSYAPN